VSTAPRVSGILFADIVGFSAIKNDQQLSYVQAHLNQFLDRLVDDEKCFHKKTWGDGLLLVCYDPNDTLEYSFMLRDWIRNHNWPRLGFPQLLSIRIGLHSEVVSLMTNGSTVADVSGTQVNLAARIEPVVPENSIYCSEPFYVLVKEKSSGFAGFKDLGMKQLAKGFATVRLYEVVKEVEKRAAKEATDQEAFGVSIPKVRKEFTDVEKDNFLEEAFKYISQYMQKAGKVLEQEDRDIQFKSKVVSEEKLVCEVFVKGYTKGTCQIWLSKERFSKGIHYARDIAALSNSYMEVLTVGTDGYQLFLTSAGMLQRMAPRSGNLSYKDAAELYWNALISQLR
jgi:class 3 adenylate cyclase